MKKHLLWGMGCMALVLSACSQSSGVDIGQGFSMGVNVLGGESSVSVSTKVITNTQPTASFTVAAQSLSLTLTSYHVEFKNKDGTAYGGSYGILDSSTSARIPGGFECIESDGTTIDSTVVDQCLSGETRTPFARTVSYSNSLPIVGTGLSNLIGTQCLSSSCPDLYYNITFYGTDGDGRSQSITINNVFYSAHTAT